MQQKGHTSGTFFFFLLLYRHVQKIRYDAYGANKDYLCVSKMDLSYADSDGIFTLGFILVISGM